MTETTAVESPTSTSQTGYAPANGLQIYYEIHGEDQGGVPVILLHGAYMVIPAMEPLLSGLAATRQVIAVEAQAHGRTADIDRPITYEHMADDTAALIRRLGLGPVDVVGYSMGAATGLQLVIRHPDLVRKLVPISVSYTSDGMQPALFEMLPSMSLEMFAGSPMEAAYLELAPNPGDFGVLVEKLIAHGSTPFAWPDYDIRGITAPVLVVLGDADVVTIEHAAAMFRLLGGGGMGDLGGFSASRLAILPGTSHSIPGSGILDRTPWLLAMIPAFLDEAPPTAPEAP